MSSSTQESSSTRSGLAGSLTIPISHLSKLVAELLPNYEDLKHLEEPVSQFGSEDFVAHIQRNYDTFIHSLLKQKDALLNAHIVQIASNSSNESLIHSVFNDGSLFRFAQKVQFETGHKKSYFLDLSRNVSGRLQDLQTQLPQTVLKQLSTGYVSAPVPSIQAIANRVADQVNERLSSNFEANVQKLFDESFKIEEPSGQALPAFLSECLHSQTPSSQSTPSKVPLSQTLFSIATSTSLPNRLPCSSTLLSNTTSLPKFREPPLSQISKPNIPITTASSKISTSQGRTPKKGSPRGLKRSRSGFSFRLKRAAFKRAEQRVTHQMNGNRDRSMSDSRSSDAHSESSPNEKRRRRDSTRNGNDSSLERHRNKQSEQEVSDKDANDDKADKDDDEDWKPMHRSHQRGRESLSSLVHQLRSFSPPLGSQKKDIAMKPATMSNSGMLHNRKSRRTIHIGEREKRFLRQRLRKIQGTDLYRCLYCVPGGGYKTHRRYCMERHIVMVHKRELARAFERLDHSNADLLGANSTTSSSQNSAASSLHSSSSNNTNLNLDSTNSSDMKPLIEFKSSHQVESANGGGGSSSLKKIFRHSAAFRQKRKYNRHSEIEREIFHKYTGQQRPFPGTSPFASQATAEPQAVIYRCLICPYKNHRKYAVHYHLLSNHPVLFPKPPLDISRFNANCSLSRSLLSASTASSEPLQTQPETKPVTVSTNRKTYMQGSPHSTPRSSQEPHDSKPQETNTPTKVERAFYIYRGKPFCCYECKFCGRRYNKSRSNILQHLRLNHSERMRAKAAEEDNVSPNTASCAHSIRADSSELHLSRRRGRKPKYVAVTGSLRAPAFNGKRDDAAQTKVRRTLNSLSTESTKKLCSALQVFSKPDSAASTQSTGQKPNALTSSSRKRGPTGRPRGRPRKIFRLEGGLAFNSSAPPVRDGQTEPETNVATASDPSSSQDTLSQEKHSANEFVVYKYFKGDGSRYTCKLCRKVFTKNKQNALKHVHYVHGDLLRQKCAIRSSGSSSSSQSQVHRTSSPSNFEQLTASVAATASPPTAILPPPLLADQILSSEMEAFHFDAPSHSQIPLMDTDQPVPLSSTQMANDTSSLALPLLASPRTESKQGLLESQQLSASSGSSIKVEFFSTQNSQELSGIKLMLHGLMTRMHLPIFQAVPVSPVIKLF